MDYISTHRNANESTAISTTEESKDFVKTERKKVNLATFTNTNR